MKIRIEVSNLDLLEERIEKALYHVRNLNKQIDLINETEVQIETEIHSNEQREQ